MAKLIVTRPSGFLHKKQIYKVLVDGQEVGSVKSGETFETEVAAGAHTVQTGMGKFSGMSRVVYFDTGDGQPASFSTDCPPWTMIFMFLAVLCGVGAGRNLSYGQIGGALFSIIFLVIWYFVGLQFFVRLKRVS